MKHITPSKICGAVVVLDVLYMIGTEGSYTTWTIFFVFLALTILLNKIEEQHDEIQSLRSRKEVPEEPPRDERASDTRRYDPFYISDRFNPNYKKMKDEKDKQI